LIYANGEKMEALKCYWTALNAAEKAEFAKAAGTSVGCIAKTISVGKPVGPDAAIRFERASKGKVRVEQTCPDSDWAGLFAVRGL
jgi:DNA-binding transcriptional regulator YdaS (Cro superfamily)